MFESQFTKDQLKAFDYIKSLYKEEGMTFNYSEGKLPLEDTAFALNYLLENNLMIQNRPYINGKAIFTITPNGAAFLDQLETS